MKLDRDLKDLKVLFDEDTLQKRIKELAKEIENKHKIIQMGYPLYVIDIA